MVARDIHGPVAPELVGDNAPSVRPGDDPVLYGTARLTPTTPVEVRSFQTFRLVYTVGRLGLDDTGGIQVAFRRISDSGKPQISQPAAANFTTAASSGAGQIQLAVGMDGLRPWNLVVTATQRGGFLSEGETIEIVFGDTSFGSPGIEMQTFVEAGYDFRVAADIQATGNYQPLGQQLSVPIIAGPPVRWRAVLPSLRRPGEAFQLGLKAEDQWGNPTEISTDTGRLRLVSNMEVAGLPTTCKWKQHERAMILEGLTVRSEGTLRVGVFLDDMKVAEAGPLIIRAGSISGYWGDLHGQSGETVGIGRAESYFEFARNLAFLDVTSHQGNDFQINSRFWNKLNDLTKTFNEPGRFIVFPGYEWSGNTAVGGDHNVFFRTEGEQIRRCSHALLEDRSDLSTDCNTLSDLYAALRDVDAVMYAHVGGRYADIAYDHDANLETAVEIHSAWGTFEWIVTDGFKIGRRVGIVANSDGHKGRPGASYPGSSTFGAYGGLTCFLCNRLDRDSIFEAMRRRHHYATTGCRLHLDVTAHFATDATVYLRNPDTDPQTPTWQTRTAIMGDIVHARDEQCDFSFSVSAPAGIERIEIRSGEKTIETARPIDRSELGSRIRVLWSGAEYRGRGRTTTWQGRAVFVAAKIRKFKTVNHWNPERQFEQRGSNLIVWRTVTTGNFMGFDAWLDEDSTSRLQIATNHGDIDIPTRDIGYEDVTLEAGGLGRCLRITRLPDEPLEREFSATRRLAVNGYGDTPLWVCVTTEDGFQAWSSPIYIFR
ncbi:MAG: DUF3604 domain-containing protein [Hyphomicrobiaceae bacterium]